MIFGGDVGLITLIVFCIVLYYFLKFSNQKKLSKKHAPIRVATKVDNIDSLNSFNEVKPKQENLTSTSLASQEAIYSEKIETNNRKDIVELQNPSRDLMQSFKDDQDENLVTFTISVGTSEKNSSNVSLGQWIKQGESVRVKEFESNKGFFYFGGKLQAYKAGTYYNSHETEASLVDESLRFEKRDQFYTDSTLSYWPKYIELSPSARGAYLNWLFGERSDPETPIGYVFIYFYGLERRILIDSTEHGTVDDDEFIAIFDELNRLRQIFEEHYAFFNYSTRLIEMMVYLRPYVLKFEYSDISTRYDSLLFKYYLAKQVQAEQPITSELALLWIQCTDEYNLRTPARRCAEEFAILFSEIYLKETKGGLVVKPNKTKLRLDYYPASGTLRGFQLDPIDLPDPSILKAPIKKLANIADQCTDALEQYSRYLGRKGTNKEDIEAILLLPNTLENISKNKLLNEFEVWANEKIDKHAGLVLFSELWSFMGKSLPEKLNKKEIDLLESFLSLGNYSYAPDHRVHKIKPSINGYIVLTHGSINRDHQISSAFNRILLFIRLAVIIAKSDDKLHEKEQALVHKIIDEDEHLTINEKSSLKAYFLWSMHTPPNTVGLKQQIEVMDKTSTANFRKMLIQMTLADGTVEASEIKQLEKLYTMLGIDKSCALSDLHQYGSQKKSDRDVKLVPIPTSSFIIDESILAQHEAETKEVQALLGSIFTEENIVDEQIEPALSSPVLSVTLDKQHNELFKILISKEKWLREEIESICAKFDLLVDGALETINDWAYEVVDAPVFEDDGDIFVDQEIVSELKGE